MKKYLLLFAVTLISASLLSTGCDVDTNTGELDWETPPPANIFAKNPDPDKIITIDAGSGSEYQFPVNQMLFVMNEFSTEEDAAALALSAGGSVVGQIPDIGLYQIELNTNSQSELDDAISDAQMYAGVKDATYNLILQARSVTEACRHEDDVDKLGISDRCPFIDIHYSSFTPLMEKVKEEMELGKVKVAVIDSGLLTTNGQFDNVRIFNMTNPGLPTTESTGEYGGHGTMVTGVIAADNKDGVTNGIASRALGNKLEIYIASDGSLNTMNVLVHLFLATQFAGADVVNMSFGCGGIVTIPQLAAIRRIFKHIMELAPNTVFVAAAANKPFTLTTTNDAPAGIQLPNVITVGGTSSCDPDSEWYTSATSGSSQGPLIDVAAPAEWVAVVDPYIPGVTRYPSGNSFATPQVTSLAAILRSIDPMLTAQDVKDYILTNTFPTTAKVGYRRFILPIAIEQVLIDMNAPESVLEYVDADEEGTWDTPGLVEVRLCGGTNISIENEGTFNFPAKEDSAMSVINPMGMGIGAGDEDGAHIFSLHIYEVIEFLQTFNINDAAVDCCTAPGVAHVAFAKQEGGYMGGGTGAGGTVSFNKCKITERDGLFDQPLVIQLEGQLDGSLHWQEPPDIWIPVGRTITAQFNLPLIVMLASPEMIDYMELMCVGGRLYP